MTRKGIAAERQLVKLFWQNDFGAIRVPASGAGSKNFPKPDIIAGNGVKYYALEVKTINLEKIYLYENEIEELQSFSEAFGCIPLVAVKFKQKSREWRFFRIPNLKRTSSGNYKIEFDEDFSNGMNFSHLLKDK